MMPKILSIVCFTFLATFAFGQESSTSFPWPSLPTLPPDAIVDAGDLGEIQGAYTYTSPNGKRFYWFAGIPYADPASYTGDNRFRPSSLVTGPLSSDKPFPAVNFLVTCPQRDIFYRTNTNMSDLGEVMQTYRKSLTRKSREQFKASPRWMGDEECLVINVNTPKIPSAGDTTLLPVLFFIHGGSFDSIWGGIFGGHRFINRDVVVVTINYRLGLLGSLNLGVDEAPGNAAMYDVITALEWTQKYIHHFGGDKDSVTVSGHSAGSVMATHLLTSPLTRDSNLFHKVIGLSGSSVSAWATCTDPASNYLRTARHANCNQTDNTEIALCMRGKSIDELMQALNNWEGEETAQGKFGFDAKIPSLQTSPLPNTPIFMDETPLQVFLQGRQKDVPVMLGATRHDGSFVMEGTYEDFLLRQGWLDDMTKLRNEFFPLLLNGLGMEDTTGGAMLHSMAHTYLGPDAMNSDNFTDMIPGMIDIHSVIAFKAGAYNLLELHSKVNPQSYYFAFDYYGFWTVDGGDVIPGGVGHIDSIFYLFQAFPLVVWPPDLAVSRRFVDYWVNFAEFGDPNGPEGSDILFPPYDPHTHTYLIINGSDKIGYNCRDSWIDNSIEIKDNQRPGWWPGPTLRPIISTPSGSDTPPTTTPGSSDSTTTPGSSDATTTSGSSDATTQPPQDTSTSTNPTSTNTGETSPSSTTESGDSFANYTKPFKFVIFLFAIATIFH